MKFPFKIVDHEKICKGTYKNIPEPPAINHLADFDYSIDYREGRAECIKFSPVCVATSGQHYGFQYVIPIFEALRDHYPILKQWRYQSGADYIQTYHPVSGLTDEDIAALLISTQAAITDMIDDYLWFKHMAQLLDRKE